MHMEYKNLLNTLGASNKSDVHSNIEQFFLSNQRLVSIEGNRFEDLNKANWPKGSGVYVIRQRGHHDLGSILYIGKTGKLKSTDNGTIKMNSGSLKQRLKRWTPYCFQSQGCYKDHFEYGPNFSVNLLKKQPMEGRYRERIPFKEIEIVCFSTAGIELQISPALLESLLLSNYVVNEGKLPPVNQEL
jgi:hypothetical protein